MSKTKGLLLGGICGLVLGAGLIAGLAQPNTNGGTGGGPVSPSKPCTGSFCSMKSPLSGALGGTGVSNTGRTLTLGASLTTTGTSPGTFALPSSGAVVYTLPGSSATLARTDAGQTFTGANTFTGTLTTNITGGGTQCAQVSNTGVLSGTAAACAVSAPSAMMHLVTGDTIVSNNTFVNITFDSVDFDTAGICSTVSHVCTPTTAGKYRVTCRTQVTASGTVAASDALAGVVARKNGSSVAGMNFSFYASAAGTGNIAEAEVNGIVTVNGSTDTIGCAARVSYNVFSSGSVLGNGDNYLIINYVGP